MPRRFPIPRNHAHVAQTQPWRRPLREVNHEPAGRVFRGLAHFANFVISRVALRNWSGQENIPSSGPVIVIANHISNADPAMLGEYLIWSGRWVHFLGKSEIWKVPVLGWLGRACEQIPVYRNTERAVESLVHAREALAKGQLVGIYPEGSITKDPDGWPMTGRRGAAQLAILSGAPVVPVVQVGSDQILGGHKLDLRRLLTGRHEVHIVAGSPIDLSDVQGRELTKELADDVTNRFLNTLTQMRAQVTGLTPPAGRWDTRVGARVPHQ